MAKVIFILSTGRCSTQFLARLLTKGDANTLVVHEGAGPNFKPAQVFRNTNFEKVLAETHQLQDLFGQIDTQLASGGRFIETGWPAYGWGPYLQKRYGDEFGFVHLLRNPFATAASMTTHALLGDGDDTLSKHGIIRPHIKGVLYPGFQSDYAEFSYFERGLYHWLEVHSFLLDQSHGSSFLGLFRFEDLYKADSAAIRDLWAKCGFDPDKFQELPAYDQFNARARRGYAMKNKKLLTLVWDLAQRLGYSDDLLQRWSDVDFLSDYFNKIRVPRTRPRVR